MTKSRTNKSRPQPDRARNASKAKGSVAAKTTRGEAKKTTARPGVRGRKPPPRQARTRAVVIGVAVVAVALIAFAAISARERRQRDLRQLTTGACKVDDATDSGGEHVPDPVYRVDPPSGGDHLGSAAPGGFFDPGQAPPDGAAVHSLQHGYVDIWYRANLDQAGLDSLRGVFNTYPKDLLVIPHPSLSQPVAATAWHHRLLCSSVDTAALTAFAKTYRNQGPEKVPHE